MGDITFTGLSSGIDTQSIVDQLMEIERQPISTLMRKQSQEEMKKAIWGSINSDLLDLQEAAESLRDKLEGNYKTASLSESGVVSVDPEANAVDATYSIEVLQLAKAMTVAGDTIEGSIGLAGSFDMTVAGETMTVTVEATDTVESLVTKINEAEGGVVDASIVDSRLILKSKETGTANDIVFSDPGGILKGIGVLTAEGAIKTTIQSSQNAQAKVNNLLVERSSNVWDDVVSEVKITLQSEGNASATIKNDGDQLKADIQKFLDEYNDLMDSLSEELTKENGLLKGDLQLSTIRSQLRASVYNNFGGAYEYVFQIGIETKDKEGHLEIADPEKLVESFELDKEGFVGTFFNDVNGDEEMDSDDTGLLSYLNNYSETFTEENDGVIAMMISSFESRVEQWQGKIEDMEKRLEVKREFYNKKFLAMEQAISTFTAQGDYLIGALGAMSVPSVNTK